jgi:hypothetical protein
MAGMERVLSNWYSLMRAAEKMALFVTAEEYDLALHN